MVFDEGFHLGLGEGVDGLFQLIRILRAPVFDQLVRTEAFVALTAVHERIGKTGQMTAGLPGHRIHEDGGVKPYVVRVLLHEFLPPRFLDVVLQLNAQRAVIPCIGKPAVYFRTGEDESAVLTEGNDFFHGLFHNFQFLSICLF